MGLSSTIPPRNSPLSRRLDGAFPPQIQQNHLHTRLSSNTYVAPKNQPSTFSINTISSDGIQFDQSNNHHRSETEVDWLYDRNAELETEVDKLVNQVKMQNMMARNEGRRATAKIDALEAALLGLERQNAKLVAEGKRAKIRDRRENMNEETTGRRFYGQNLSIQTRKPEGMPRAESPYQRYEVHSPVGTGDDTRLYGAIRRSPSESNGFTLAEELEKIVEPVEEKDTSPTIEQAALGSAFRPNLVNTPPTSEAVLHNDESVTVDVHEEAITPPVLPPKASPKHKFLSPRRPTGPASNSSAVPSPLQPERVSTPSDCSHYTPLPRLRVSSNPGTYSSQSKHKSSLFHVYNSPGSPFASPDSTMGWTSSRFPRDRKTLASELAGWALDMDDDTMEQHEMDSVLNEAGMSASQSAWITTRSGSYSMMEKESSGDVFTDRAAGVVEKKEDDDEREGNPSHWVGRLVWRLKTFVRSTWMEVQCIWVVLLFLRRVWIEGRRGLIIRSGATLQKRD
jgi:hypothetical protein